MTNRILPTRSEDGIDRRGFLECMAWAGTGLLWTISGGVARSQQLHQAHETAPGSLSFVQISDSHIGFNKDANPDVIATLEAAVARIRALPTPPAFLLHTGDISHLSKAAEFDTAEQILKSSSAGEAFYVPGEHDVLGDDGKLYLERYGKRTRGTGWYSFDHQGVHFAGLVNVRDLQAGGLGLLGEEQLEWLEKDLQALSASTPIVVFAHIPLWPVYPAWGWGTDDGARAVAYLKRFGSVTVLNGHIHQVMQKVEGNITFHTAAATAFPQPQPGAAASPGPLKVPAERLRSMLGLTQVSYTQGTGALAIVDSSLAEPASSAAAGEDVHIDNFSFTPGTFQAQVGQTVTWINRDDVPHNVVSPTKAFASPVMDTGERFSFRFTAAGEYPYYCTLHPRMTGKVVVEGA